MSAKFRRPLGNRRYKKMFVVACEGEQTEPQYFDIFNRKELGQELIVHVKHLRGNKNAPGQVLARMTKHLKQSSLSKTDEAWIIVDKDQWTGSSQLGAESRKLQLSPE